MGLFDEVKQNVTVRQAVELYGLKPNRSGLIRCIFHNDKSPSMKVDRSREPGNPHSSVSLH